MTLAYFHLAMPLNFIGFFTGMVSCYFLQKYGALSSVLAASTIGLIASFVPTNKFTIHFPATLYAGAFIGMGTFVQTMNVLHILSTASIAAILYTIGISYFHGIGGRLGFIALLSTVLFLILKTFL